MLIEGNNTYQYRPVSFKARVDLKTLKPLLSEVQTGTSPLDAMLDYGKGMQKLENLTLFLKRSVDNKYFQGEPSYISKKFHHIVNYTIMKLRKASLKLFLMKNDKALKEINSKFMQIDQNSPEYIEELAKLCNSMEGKFFITNVEKNPLKDIGKSDQSTIFVLNHPNYHRDKYTYAIINSILNKLYVQEGKQATCPRPKILVSNNMLNAVGENIGKIYQKLGMIPIDAGIEKRDKLSNALHMKQLMLDFINNTANIFIFPEGRNCMRTMPLEKRLQPGVAAFINKALNFKKTARVVPIGINYTDEANSFGKIFIGKPIYIKKSGDKIVYTHGTEHRKVQEDKSKNAISVILSEICDNLSHCINKAGKLT